MTFVISKLFWGVAAPGNLLVLLLVAGLVVAVAEPTAARARHRRPGSAGVAGVDCAARGRMAGGTARGAFPGAGVPERVDGIVVLGGAVETRTSRGSEVHLNDSADRVVEAAVLARRYPDAKLLASGGDGNLIPDGEQEAELTRDLLIALGVAPERILVEDRSRNTIENAIYSRDMAQPKPGEVWLLVTSAWHMPRAVGCFRRAGFDVLPYPVDFARRPRKLALLAVPPSGAARHRRQGMGGARLLSTAGAGRQRFPGASRRPTSANTRR